jgi:predicted nucleotidyltransferase
MSEREIASILKISHMSINRAMKELTDINFVDFVTVGKAHLWRVNTKSYAYKTLSSLMRGISLVKPPLEDLKSTILENLPKNLVKKAVLFGSIAKGLEKTDSDIDIFILVRDKDAKETLGLSIEKLSRICFELYGNRLAPYVLTEKESRQKERLKILSEAEKGIQIFPRIKG